MQDSEIDDRQLKLGDRTLEFATCFQGLLDSSWVCQKIHRVHMMAGEGYRWIVVSALAGCVGYVVTSGLFPNSGLAESALEESISPSEGVLEEPFLERTPFAIPASTEAQVSHFPTDHSLADTVTWSIAEQIIDSVPVPEGEHPSSPDETTGIATDALSYGVIAELEPTGLTAQDQPATPPPGTVSKEGSTLLGQPEVRLQGVFKQEGDESSARGRIVILDPLSPSTLLGVVVDLTTGNGFSDSPDTGLRLSELYYAVSPAGMPNLKFVGGLMDFTSYFDRNSFAKDGANHFFNRAFQTNPALSAAGLGSRVGLLANWDITDTLQVKVGTFSAARGLGNFALDSVVGEVGVRFGTAIIRGTYLSSKDAGRDTGFEEIFSIPRGNDRSLDFGLKRGDREQAVGVNGEFYIPKWKLGLFGRYGYYWNRAIEEGGQTFSVGATLLGIFMPKDRLGVAYGWQLTNDKLRRDRDDKRPDVLEVYYDFRISPNLRAAVSLQQRNQFTETVFGFRITTDFDISPWVRRLFR